MQPLSRVYIVHSDFDDVLTGRSAIPYRHLILIGYDLPLQPTVRREETTAGHAVPLSPHDLVLVQQVDKDRVGLVHPGHGLPIQGQVQSLTTSVGWGREVISKKPHPPPQNGLHRVLDLRGGESPLLGDGLGSLPGVAESHQLEQRAIGGHRGSPVGFHDPGPQATPHIPGIGPLQHAQGYAVHVPVARPPR